MALRTCQEEGNDQVILLKCVSDHSMGTEAAVASIVLGAKVIEKHMTLRRADGGPDAAFSMEPEEFAYMVSQIRNIEKASGSEKYILSDKQIAERKGARSLFVVDDMKKGDLFTEKNLRSIRPNRGLHTKHYETILGQRAKCDIKKGTPMDWKYLD